MFAQTLRGSAAAALVVLAGGCGMFHGTTASNDQTNKPNSPTTANSQTPGTATMTVAAANTETAGQTGTNPGQTTANSNTNDEPAPEAQATLNVSRATFAEEGADFNPSLSPDGTRLFFASTQHRGTSDLYVKRVDSRVVTQLTTDPADDAMPAVSPDGSKLAFASNRAGNWDIYIMPTSGGKAVRVTDDEANELHPSWSPDGSQLVYSRQSPESGRWEMWVASTANPGTPNFVGYGLFPQWCPVAGTGEDGADRILFQQPRERGGRTFGVWTLDITDGKAANTTEIASSASSAYINPTWSHDGRWIVFAEVPTANGADAKFSTKTARPTSGSLWLMSVEGEGRVRLTAGAGVNLGPVWGPNNRLFFVSDRTGHDNVWSLDLRPAMTSAMAAMPNHDRSASSSGGHGSESRSAQAGDGSLTDNTPVATAPEHEPSTPRD